MFRSELSNNDLNSLPVDAFVGQTRLLEIILDGNDIKYLTAGTFDGLVDLTDMYVISNRRV